MTKTLAEHVTLEEPTSKQWVKQALIQKQTDFVFPLDATKGKSGLKDHLFGKELFIRFTVCVFRERSSVCVYASFPSGF